MTGVQTCALPICGGTLITHRESIELFKNYGGKFTPELKSPMVEMPYEGFTQEHYAQALIDEYKQAGIPAEDVFPQSFNLNDILYWIKKEPDFGKQAIYLDERYLHKGFDPQKPGDLQPSMASLYQQGVRYIAPPIWVLLATSSNNQMVASEIGRAHV